MSNAERNVSPDFQIGGVWAWHTLLRCEWGVSWVLGSKLGMVAWCIGDGMFDALRGMSPYLPLLIILVLSAVNFRVYLRLSRDLIL